MQPWVFLKLSYGILKESLLHPRAMLVLDKTSGKVSHRYEISGPDLGDLEELREAVNIYRQWKNKKATLGEEVQTDMGSSVSPPTCPQGHLVLVDAARFCPQCGTPLG